VVGRREKEGGKRKGERGRGKNGILIRFTLRSF